MTGYDRSDSVADRIAQLRLEVPSDVRLIAVTKQVPVALIRQAYHAGIRNFGESKIQEALSKQAELQDLSDITWHLIGHLQSNKARLAVQHFDWIHSVDSLKLAHRLNSIAQELGVHPKVCLQVKIVPDPQKYGWSVEELETDLQQLSQCHHLDIQGLMVILPLGLTPEAAFSTFQQAQQLRQQIQAQNWKNMPMQELSMGMSGDYLAAIKAGATMIRLGQILFGQRI